MTVSASTSAPAPPDPASRSKRASKPTADRSLFGLIWYRLVQYSATQVFSIGGGIRATGREHLPAQGGAILVSNHLSHLDVFVLGILLQRPLNYVARSTLFIPGLGFLIRSVGGFAIQREGRGSEGFKETLRRVRSGAIVTFFPEGTRTPDGDLGELKPGIVALATRAGVPIIPAAIAGTFESWPRTRRFPRPYPIRVHYGEPILPSSLEGKSSEEVVALIRDHILECQAIARKKLAGDLGT